MPIGMGEHLALAFPDCRPHCPTPREGHFFIVVHYMREMLACIGEIAL